MTVIRSHFLENLKFSAIMQFERDSLVFLDISSTNFSDNGVSVDIGFESNSKGIIQMKDCQFLRGNNPMYPHVHSLNLLGLYDSDYNGVSQANKIENTVFESYETGNTSLIQATFVTSGDELYLSNIDMQNIIGVGVTCAEGLVSENSTFYNISDTVIDFSGANLTFLNNTAIDNQASIIRYAAYAGDVTLQPFIDIGDNVFERNLGDILDFVPVVVGGSQIEFHDNVFDNNGGCIYDLTIQSDGLINVDGTKVTVYGETIKNYNNPPSALYGLSQSALDCNYSINWPTDIYFENLIFDTNVDTQFISTACVSVPIRQTTLSDNTMLDASTPMFLFGEFTEQTNMQSITASNNTGVMIEFQSGNSQFYQHTVSNHNGVYIFYNVQKDYATNLTAILLHIDITNSQSEDALVILTGNATQLSNTWMYLQSVNFINNTGTLINIQPNILDSSLTDSTTSCPLSQVSDVNVITQCSFLNNSVDDGYFFGIRGVELYFDSSIQFMDNHCSSSTACLSLLDGWYTLNFDFDNTAEFIEFGHSSTQEQQPSINLCIADTMDPSQIVDDVSFVNVNISHPQNNERVTFLPTPCDFEVTLVNQTLHSFGDYIGVSSFAFSAQASNIFSNATCTETDCEIICDALIACFKSSFYCNSGACNIECSEEYSCTDTTIYKQESQKANEISKVSIICDANSACSGSEIIMYDVDEFRLICSPTSGQSSCYEVTVNISGNNNVSEIYCQGFESCESLTVYTDNPNTTVFMYSYSSKVTIHSPLGYINEAGTNSINLHCGHPDQYMEVTGALTAESAVNTFFQNRLPCDDVTFFCNNYTDSTAQSCQMDPYFLEEAMNNLPPYPLFECYPTLLTDLYSNNCLGACPNSPTESPTSAPTTTPTEQHFHLHLHQLLLHQKHHLIHPPLLQQMEPQIQLQHQPPHHLMLQLWRLHSLHPQHQPLHHRDFQLKMCMTHICQLRIFWMT